MPREVLTAQIASIYKSLATLASLLVGNPISLYSLFYQQSTSLLLYLSRPSLPFSSSYLQPLVQLEFNLYISVSGKLFYTSILVSLSIFSYLDIKFKVNRPRISLYFQYYSQGSLIYSYYSPYVCVLGSCQLYYYSKRFPSSTRARRILNCYPVRYYQSNNYTIYISSLSKGRTLGRG